MGNYRDRPDKENQRRLFGDAEKTEVQQKNAKEEIVLVPPTEEIE